MSSREKAAERRLTREIPPLKTPIAANAVFLVCILFFGGLYLSSKYWSQSKPLQDSLKSIASVLFLLCCVFNVCFSEARDKEKRGVSYRRLLLLGQAFACTGDIVLNFDFTVGAAFFALGHVLFFAAFCSLEGFSFRGFAAFLAVAALSFCLLRFYRGFDFKGLEVVVYAYAVVISCMLGKAFSVAASPILDKRVRSFVLFGALLFYLSDLMLVFHQFAGGGRLFDGLCLSLYYPAEFLLAVSILAVSACGLTKEEKPVSKMPFLRRLYCRSYQTVFRLAIPFLPYRRPQILHTVSETADVLKKAGADKVLLVTDAGIYGAGLTKEFESVCAKENIDVFTYKDTVANPTVSDVEKAHTMYELNECKAIVAFGGGSAMDCAKAAGARVVNPKKPLSKMKGVLHIFRRLPLLIAVPTTAGTGSETTLAAVITDDATRHKYPINAFCLIPRYALLDEKVTFALPPFFTATTGMDALTHAVEAYIGNSTTRETRAAAEEAVRLIFRYLPRAYADGKDAEARKGMQRAAYLAGIAFTKSYVGYVHAVAHSLGGKYNIPHGLANAVILPYFLKEYGLNAAPRLAALAIKSGVADPGGDFKGAAKKFIRRIEDLNESMGIPRALSGIRAEDVPELAAFADAEANPLYPVPKLMTKKELEVMYFKISDHEGFPVDKEGKPDFDGALQRQKRFFQSGVTLNPAYRICALKALYNAVKDAEGEINEALKADLGKSAFESYMCEVGMTLSEISYMIGHVRRFSKKKRVKTPLAQFASKSFIQKSPYGTVLIMSPWNYPFMLAMEPLADALAAGNTAIVKPSAYSPNVSRVLKDLIARTFPSEYVTVATGGRAENAKLLEMKFDKIFFTGSVGVGKEVMKKAAENLVPVTLELGGKSPCIVDETANLALAAKRIVFGKYLNLGQTCVAPDYVYVAANIKDAFLTEIKRQITAQYGKDPLKEDTYGKIVNRKHFDRISALIDGKKVVFGGGRDEASLQIEPTVLDGVIWADEVMGEEIFGPVMPVLTFERMDEVIEEVNAHPSPLALYLFSSDKRTISRVLERCRFGGGCVNDTIIHLATSEMAFGGFGASGMGSYHGKKGFECFTHEKSIVDKKTFIDLPMRYRPYKKFNEKLLRFFLK